ncbi:Uncharacterized protein TCM_026155 [Theobroma cacao]|uniref:Uncharacterized protein n=1 Tax=Theobroma cacao TaxID=3641 RepID=A0A061F1D1_THECC|nr:Uncharacterized protein TCM_026155 [Theobroma cacao]
MYFVIRDRSPNCTTSYIIVIKQYKHNVTREVRRCTHGVILVVVLGIVVLAPFLLGDQGDAITEAITELLSSVDLLLLPIILLLTIRFFSSDRGSFIPSISSTGEPDSIHLVSCSPFGVALFLVAPQTLGSSLPHTTFTSLVVMMTPIFDSASI